MPTKEKEPMTTATIRIPTAMAEVLKRLAKDFEIKNTLSAIAILMTLLN
jgi:hypothetical protein